MTPPLPKLMTLADLAEVVATTPESLSMRLSREPAAFPPRWVAPGKRRKARTARLWHPADVHAWLEAGRQAGKK